jgi:hypothetical protein
MTWGRRLYFPFEERRAADFFALNNPSPSGWFEPTNLGYSDEHANHLTTEDDQFLRYILHIRHIINCP